MKCASSSSLLHALIVICCLSSTALAQDTPNAQTFAQEGEKSYVAKDYDAALTNFLKSYKLNANPSMAYNLARVYEAKKDYANAEKYYRIFADSPDVNVNAREDAVKRIKMVRSLAEFDKEATKPKVVVTPPKEEIKVAAETPPPKDEIKPPVDEVQASGPGTLTWVLLGTGLASAGVGLTFGVLAGQSQDELAAACKGEQNGLCPESSMDLAQTMKQRALIADISYVAGGALISAGIITWLITSGKDEAPTSLLIPTLTPSSAGASWHMRF